MKNFENSKLWQRTLGATAQQHQAVINRLKENFLSFRDRVGQMAIETHRSLPEYTLHDLSHIDSLWELSDSLLGDQYPVNPVEAFVLGGAFLLHDLGMALAAYPNEFEELRKNPIWHDHVKKRLERLLGRNPSKEEIANPPREIHEDVVAIMLRRLHAEQAERLPLLSWQRANGEPIFLIEHAEIRQAFGALIGRIAHSHWWDIQRLEDEFSRTQGAPHWAPNEWTIDPLKLACILRIADAAHVDASRAPYFLRILRRLSEESDLHWAFQQKLQRPYRTDDTLFFTSGQPFTFEDSEAWWLAYDALKLVDKELREVDALLADKRMPRVAAKRVFGVDSPERLATVIPTQGWYPFDAVIHVSDIPRLIRSLGAEELYGRDLNVPIRELIQNASDAIRARRTAEQRNEQWGEIEVVATCENGSDFVTVTDNGIGMSINVIRDYLFDFGTSYWGSELMSEEYPGLSSKLEKQTGRFGIGFFSVFMLGDEVEVVTRQSRAGQEDTLVVQFKEGVSTRPVIRKARVEERLIDGGTRIKIRLREATSKYLLGTNEKPKQLTERCLRVAPALDVAITVIDKEELRTRREPNYWLKCSEREFVEMLIPLGHRYRYELEEDVAGRELSSDQIDKLASQVRYIVNEPNIVVGRALLTADAWVGVDRDVPGIICVGGLFAEHIGIGGFLLGEAVRASRDEARVLAKRGALAKWATEQAQLVDSGGASLKAQLAMAQVVWILGGKTGPLPIATDLRQSWDYEGFIKLAKEREKLAIVDSWFSFTVVKDVDAVRIGDGMFLSNASFAPNVLGRGAIDDLNDRDEHVPWQYRETLLGAVASAVAEAWQVPSELMIKYVGEYKDKRIVAGDYKGDPIEGSGVVFDKNGIFGVRR